MGRDPKRYIYFTIGIPRNGTIHQALKADAEEHNTKHLPTVAVFRLSEYYRLMSGTLHAAHSAGREQEAQAPELTNIDAANEAWPE